MNHSNLPMNVSNFNNFHHPDSHSHQHGSFPWESYEYPVNSFGERFWPASEPQLHRYEDPVDRIGLTGGGESSPALSALGLLAFLFFLNMIQNSVMTSSLLAMRLRNRNVTRTIRNRRTTRRPAMVAGRNFDDDDDLVGIDLDFPTSQELDSGSPENTSSEDGNPYANFIEGDFKIGQNSGKDDYNQSEVHQESQIESPVARKTTKKRKRFRRGLLGHGMSVKCLQLFACKLGRRLHTGLGGIISTFMRSFVIPKSKQYLGPGLSRALSIGWSSRKDCRDLYKECKILHDLIASKGDGN